MHIIRHRVNSLVELKRLSPEWGAEIDLRSRGNEIILNHEPFSGGDSFDAFAAEWIAGRHRGTLILNPKEDGLETRAIEILERQGIDDFFFLDLPIPTTVRLAVRAEMRKLAVRVSEYETIESARCFVGKAEWAWLDSFSGAPPDVRLVEELKGKFKLCLVSPELQGFPAQSIGRFLPLAPRLDAVCTKHPDRWGAK